MLLRPSDPSAQAVNAARWRFDADGDRQAVLEAAACESRAGTELFEDCDEPAILLVSWSAAPSVGDSRAALSQLHTDGVQLEWTAAAERVATWRSGLSGDPNCLVVVRQPLREPDAHGQQDWIASVLRALDGDAAPPPGLLTANFFATRDGRYVLNFAEWTSPDAHRAALRRGSYGRHGSIGSSPLWRATREHPAITPEHEVHRYAALPSTGGVQRMERGSTPHPEEHRQPC
jgi:hypothetical protein